MSEIPYTPFPGKIEKYFEKIRESGVPEKVNRKWLSSVGFASGNDTYILSIWKHIGFLDQSNVPTEFWRKYKDPAQSKSVLAQAIRSGYSDLFRTYEDAYRKDREAIYSYFSAKTDKAESTINLMVTTLANLCGLADFEAPRKPEEPIAMPRPEEAVSPGERQLVVPQIHINIQLHLPETNDPTVYDNLFKSLRKHLFADEK